MTEELKSLIQTSFLQESDKEKLRTYLAENGATVEFYKFFNDLLIEDVKVREKQYRGSIGRFENEVRAVDEEFVRERKNLDLQLEENLRDVPVSDVSVREKIWDKYYREIDELYKKQEDENRNISNKVIISALS